MMLRMMQVFSKNNIEINKLTPHTSGKMQPLDVSLFGLFKPRLNELISVCCIGDIEKSYDIHEFMKMKRRAHYATFVRANIVSSFEKVGM